MQSSLTSRGSQKGQESMPALSSTTKRRQKKADSRAKRNRCLAIGIGFVAAIVWMSYIMLWAQSLLSETDDKNAGVVTAYEESSPSTDRVNPASSVTDMQPDDYEDIGFYKMLKSCDPTKPNNKCQQNIPPGTTTHRVGILSPPGELSDFFANWVKDVIKVHSTEKTDIALLPTSHVPPYGYGKNHGWTKIIRFTSLPLGLASADALRSARHDNSDDFTLSDLKAATRQIIRWHNRLSHVAAHTSLLTVTLDDLLDDPFDVEDRICSFLSVEKVISNGGHIDEEELIGSVQPIVELDNRVLTQIGHSSALEKAIEEVFEQVMKEEFRKSNNLSAWPCQSFWSVEDDPHPAKSLPLPIQKIAKEMSPNCSAEYTKCTVEKDRCEEKGDAICK